MSDQETEVYKGMPVTFVEVDETSPSAMAIRNSIAQCGGRDGLTVEEVAGANGETAVVLNRYGIMVRTKWNVEVMGAPPPAGWIGQALAFKFRHFRPL